MTGNGTAQRPQPGAASPGAVERIDDGDWDALARAVSERLTVLAGSAVSSAAAAHAGLLDCVQALDRLHATLERVRGRHQRLQSELREARGALARLRRELSGSPDGERGARWQSRHDELTSLPNRSHFRDRLTEVLAAAAKAADPPALAVMFVDIDDFKPINERYGKATGDELLRIVALRLARSIRADDLVGRMGDDEFACLLTAAMSRERLSGQACKLFDAVSAPLRIGALDLTVRPSIGIAVCPTDGDTADLLLMRADTAMDRARRRELGYAFFDAELTA